MGDRSMMGIGPSEMDNVDGSWVCEYPGAAAAAAAMHGEEEEEEMELRRGPWTIEEDLILVNYIANHGEGRWNSLARSAGLKRTGKSCRLRWLNYLRPDVRRGNITPEEQLLILELHCRWGNRWSKIAQHLPGRTDNEIKNYWRTRVQKHAKQLQCDVNSKQFKDVMRYLWMPRLLERIQAAASSSGSATAAATVTAASMHGDSANSTNAAIAAAVPAAESMQPGTGFGRVKPSPENSSVAGSSSDSSMGTQFSSPPVSDSADCYIVHGGGDVMHPAAQIGGGGGWPESLPSPCGYFSQGFPDFDQAGWAGEDAPENLLSAEDIWFLQQQL